jgi:BirA family biotin operon repressor/biotin-[acetyl-CoA-carboxylase] ligase
VLIENVIRNENAGNSQPAGPAAGWQWAIVGIGININQEKFPGDLQKAVSLKQITGKTWDLTLLAKELCDIIGKIFQQWSDKGFENIYERYLAALYKKDQRVKFKKGSRSFEAVVKTVSPVGRLVIQHAIEEELNFGEIEWLIP